MRYGHIQFEGTYPSENANIPSGYTPVDREISMDCQLLFQGTEKTTENLQNSRILWRQLIQNEPGPRITTVVEEMSPSLVARKSWLQQTELHALLYGIDIFDTYSKEAMKQISEGLVHEYIRKGCNRHILTFASELGTMWGDTQLQIPQHIYWLKAKLEILFVDPQNPFTRQTKCIICADNCHNVTNHVLWECTNRDIDTVRGLCRDMIPVSFGSVPDLEWTQWMLHTDRSSEERTTLSRMLREMHRQWISVVV